MNTKKYLIAIKIILVGILFMTLIDSLGSYLTGIFKYSFSYYTPLIIVFIFLLGLYSYLKVKSLWVSLLIPVIVGLFDFFIGCKLYMVFNAYDVDQSQSIYINQMTYFVITIIICGTLGILGGVSGIIYRKIKGNGTATNE